MKRSRQIGVALLASTFLCLTGLARGTAGAAASSQEFKVRIENVSKEETLNPSNGTKAVAAVAPGAWAVHKKADLFLTPGTPDRGKGLESLVEDGHPAGLAESLRHDPAVVSSGIFNVPVGAAIPGPIGSGGVFEFMVAAEPGMRSIEPAVRIHTPSKPGCVSAKR